MEERSDLPGLENVTWHGGVCGAAAFVCFVELFFAFMLVISVAMAFAMRPADRLFGYIAIAACAIPLLLLFWILRTPLFDHRWETSPEGLTIKSVIGGRFIPWKDVTAVTTRRSRPWFSLCHVLHSGGASAAVPCRDFILEASIWQHLRRVHLEKRISISEEAESLWHPILDDVWDEVSWQDHKGVSTGRACCVYSLLLFVSVIVVCLLAWCGQMRLVVSVAMVLLFLLVRGFIRTPVPRQFQVTDDALGLVLGAGKGRIALVELQWNNLCKAKWTGRSIRLQWSNRISINVPWDSSDSSSTRLILSIIKRLRMLPQAVMIPLPDDLLRHVGESANHLLENPATDQVICAGSISNASVADTEDQVFATAWSIGLRAWSVIKLVLFPVLLIAVPVLVSIAPEPNWVRACIYMLLLANLSYNQYGFCRSIPMFYATNATSINVRSRMGVACIPLSSVVSVRIEDGVDIFRDAHASRAKRWNFWVVGPYRSERVGKDAYFDNYATRWTGKVVSLTMNDGNAIVLSPDDADGFVRTIEMAMAELSKP